MPLLFRPLLRFLFALVITVLVLSSIFATLNSRAAVIDDIRTTAQLNVCTPANHSPFSFVASDRSVRGLDIELMQQLGASLHAKVNFIQINAPDIPGAIRSGKCDIGVGGLPVNLEQNSEASFSAAYLENGVTVVTNCSTQTQLRTLSDLDRDTIKVAVIRNSTGEFAARDLLNKAKIGSTTDRNGILADLAKNNINAFFTEAIDAVTIAQSRPGLCIMTTQRPLVYSEVAYLLPRGDYLTKEYIDEWLHLLKASGSFDRLLAKWMQAADK